MLVQLGTPSFILMVKDSKFQNIYLKKYSEFS